MFEKEFPEAKQQPGLEFFSQNVVLQKDEVLDLVNQCLLWCRSIKVLKGGGLCVRDNEKDDKSWKMLPDETEYEVINGQVRFKQKLN